MGLVRTIVTALIVLIILYHVFAWLFQSSTTLSIMDEGTKPIEVDLAKKVKNNGSANCTYSIWFYVNDWNYNYGKVKTLLARTDSSDDVPIRIDLGQNNNDLTVTVETYPPDTTTTTTEVGGGAGSGGTSNKSAFIIGKWAGDGTDCPIQCGQTLSGFGLTNGAALKNHLCKNYAPKDQTDSSANYCTTTNAATTIDCTQCDTGNLGWRYDEDENDASSSAKGKANSDLDKVYPSNGTAGGWISERNLKVRSGRATSGTGTGTGSGGFLSSLNSGSGGSGVGTKKTCTVKNFPLQKWVNLLVSVHQRTLDIYLNGKLVRTCLLEGALKVSGDGKLYVTPSNAGFKGWTARTQYWDDSTNPQQAYNVYKDGYGGNIIGNFINKYRVRVSFLEDNETKGSFEI